MGDVYDILDNLENCSLADMKPFFDGIKRRRTQIERAYATQDVVGASGQNAFND